MKKLDPPRLAKKELSRGCWGQCQTFLKAASVSRFYTAYLTAINTKNKEVRKVHTYHR